MRIYYFGTLISDTKTSKNETPQAKDGAAAARHKKPLSRPLIDVVIPRKSAEGHSSGSLLRPVGVTYA